MLTKLNAEYAGASNVLEGKTYDGTAPLPCPVSFTRNVHSREAARQVAATLIWLVEFNRGRHDDAFRTAMVWKFLAYLTKRGIQTPEDIVAFRPHEIADAVLESPDLVMSRAGMHAILRAHRQLAAKASAALRRSIGTDVPPRRLVWEFAGGRYRIEEATDPRHLQQDSVALKHCVGTCHNSAMLTERKLTRSDAEAVNYLHYWLRIKSGATRIFTLTDDDCPVATMEYDVAACQIVQIEGQGRARPDLELICPALHALRQLVPLKAIPDLAGTRLTRILTPRGTFVYPNNANISFALQGFYVMPADSTAADIRAAASNNLICLDVTYLPHEMLRHILKADAYLQHEGVGDITFPNLTGGNIDATTASGLHMPRFKHGDIRAEFASTLTVPLIETGDVRAYECATLSMPYHRQGTISAQAARYLDLSNHTRGSIYAPNAERIILPAATDTLKLKVICNRQLSDVLVFEAAR